MNKRSKVLIHLLLIGLLSFKTGYVGALTSLPYAKLGEMYLQSFPALPPAPVQEDKPIDLHASTTCTLSSREKRAILFSLFDRFEAADKSVDSVALEQLVHDLNLFCLHSKEEALRGQHLFSKINFTSTVFGEVASTKKLASPYMTLEQRKCNQAFVKRLVEDEKLFKKMDELVKSVQPHEDEILAFWQESAKSERETLKDLFFDNNWYLAGLNKNSAIMASNDRWAEIISVALATSVLIGLPVGCGYLYKNWGKPKVLEKVIGGAVGAAYFLFLDAMMAFPLLGIINKTNYIHRKLNHIPHLINAADALKDVLSANKSLAGALPSLQALKKFNGSKDFNELLRLLRTNTFKGQESFFSLAGRVKAAYTLMNQVKDELAVYMQFVGEVDAYLSIAKLYKHHQTTNAKYSFVTFLNQPEPYIEVKQFWNPMLDANKAVGNDLIFNEHGKKRAAVVTGSNSAGKSTIMVTGLTSTLLIGQTFGIAPAASCIMTPFDCLATSLKVQDNIATGQSHFMAETKQAAALDKMVSNLPAGSKAFIVIDELFEGTAAHVGSRALGEFLLRLVTNHQKLVLVAATQYKGEPTLLEQETDGVCKNYKVDVVIDDNGVITRPYLVEEGIGQVNIADQLLQDAYA
jgi:DNA mismatch repair ATPase MutS